MFHFINDIFCNFIFFFSNLKVMLPIPCTRYQSLMCFQYNIAVVINYLFLLFVLECIQTCRYFFFILFITIFRLVDIHRLVDVMYHVVHYLIDVLLYYLQFLLHNILRFLYLTIPCLYLIHRFIHLIIRHLYLIHIFLFLDLIRQIRLVDILLALIPYYRCPFTLH